MGLNSRRGGARLALHAGAGVCVIAHLILVTHDLSRPFAPDVEGFSGALYSIAGRNLVRHGALETRLGCAQDTGDFDGPPQHFYVSHPPLVAWAVGASFAAFGCHEWAARLPSVVLSALSVVLVYLIAGLALGPVAALVSCALYAVLPMTAAYGHMPCHEPITMAFVLFGVWQSLLFLEHGSRRNLAGCLVGLTLAQLTDWPGYVAVLGLTVAALFPRPRSPHSARLLINAWLGALLTGCLVFAHIWYVAGTFANLAERARWWTLTPQTDPFVGLETLGRLVWRWPRWFTKPGCLLAALGLLALILQPRRHPALRPLLALAVPAVLHIVVFWKGAWNHDYWIYYLSPVVALLGGVATDLALQQRSRLARGLLTAAVALLLAWTPVQSRHYLGRFWASRDLNACAELMALRDRIPADRPLVMANLYMQVAYYLDRPYQFMGGATMHELLQLPAGAVVVMHFTIADQRAAALRSAGYVRMNREPVYRTVFLQRQRVTQWRPASPEPSPPGFRDIFPSRWRR